MNKTPLLVKITCILVSTSHDKCWPFKYCWSALSSKVCKKIRVRPWWRSYVCVCVCVCMCVCVCTHFTCKDWTLCMFFTCKEQTFDEEQTHTKSWLVSASVSDSPSLGLLVATLRIKIMICLFFTFKEPIIHKNDLIFSKRIQLAMLLTKFILG